MKKLLLIFGTRPEAIKLIPLIKEVKKYSHEFEAKILITSQHKEMLFQVLELFEIIPDYDLGLMKNNQSLSGITSGVLIGVDKIIKQYKPDMIFVQGDTTSAFAGALAGFYNKIKIAHIEAGLRSKQKYSPYPEEINRKLIGSIADYHFAPTKRAQENLLAEGITENIFVVGNTVIDALIMILRKIRQNDENNYYKKYKYIDFTKKIILVTGHRRESFGKEFDNICNAILEISKKYDDIEIVYPVHLNPAVREPVYRILSGEKNIHLFEPLDYIDLIWMMSKCYMILTDSGGIQEEAPTLSIPVLVMRNITERIEGIEIGTSKLVGTNTKKIVDITSMLIENKNIYQKMAKKKNPYGDGNSSKNIIEILMKIFT